ncbi:hypothetical protein CHS0354_015839 [Potamilus streckersoni]|uniref:C1q domain-containing protein n=1 Tax=Potamilus streckersoni TaxID=2493646 RepID=A0AAE0VTA4_9BIVA|nr:hypothetical protein CHS0354_015839 [Potamilus streckersoni]
MVRKMSVELISLTNEQTKMKAAEEEKMKSVKEELLMTKGELLTAQKELLTRNEELLKTQKELISTQWELQSRMKEIEVTTELLKEKERMRRSTMTSVGFTARLSNTITTNLNSHQTLIFDNVYLNIGNGYDRATGVFHAPVAGMYVILVTISSVGGSKGEDTEVVHNGVPVCRVTPPHLNWGGSPCNAVVHLRVGDTVWVREFNHNSADQIRGDYFTTFSMGLIHKDDDGISSF